MYITYKRNMELVKDNEHVFCSLRKHAGRGQGRYRVIFKKEKMGGGALCILPRIQNYYSINKVTKNNSPAMLYS